MNITIINDCRDANEAGRQLSRVTSLFNCTAHVIGVLNELEASGNLIDILDAYGECKGVILVNVAPRNGTAKKYHNGTPFGYFWYKKVLVVSSIDGFVLSLVKKLKITDTINVLDIPETLDILIKKGTLEPQWKNHITQNQFRSYEYLPRIALFLFKYKNIKSNKMSVNEIPDVPQGIWWVDSFGNCKTTFFSDEYEKIEKLKNLKYYSRLKDVPNGKSALITGSSGFKDKRFLEVVIQGESASQAFNFKSGDVF